MFKDIGTVIAGICLLVLGVLNLQGAINNIAERERLYNKCLIEYQNKPYIEAVDTCKERVK